MKIKTIKIDETLHLKIKKFCDEQNLKLNKWCESSLGDALLYAKEYSKLKSEKKLSNVQ